MIDYTKTKAKFILFNEFLGEYEFIGTIEDVVNKIIQDHMVFGGPAGIVSIENLEGE